MNWVNGLGRNNGSWLAFVPRVVLVLVLLATVASAAAPGASAGSRPRITASYSLSGGTITVQGTHFRENTRVHIILDDVSLGTDATITRELTARTNKHGAFSVASPGWCPRTVDITVTVDGSRVINTLTLENSDCPW
jgi:hypothetical protein